MQKKIQKEFFYNFFTFIKGFFQKNLPSYELYLYEDSFKDYSFKIKIKSLHSNFQIDCVIYYSPNKNKFSFIFTKKDIEENIKSYFENVFNKIFSHYEKLLFNQGNFLEKKIEIINKKNDEIIYKNYQNNKNIKKIKLYVDGSFINGNIGYGGVILDQDDNIIYQYNGKIDNEELIKMRQIGGEIEALIKGLEWIENNLINKEKINIDKEDDKNKIEFEKDLKKDNENLLIEIYYDYEGLYKWFNGEWKTKNLYTFKYKNYISDFKMNLNWIKVKSHSKNYWNDYVDKLAKKGALI